MAPTWKFAQFELDPGNQVLRKHGKVVKLAPQPYKVLLLLVSRSGGLVRRDELRQAIWGDGVNVDFEHGLNTSMRQVRAALGDDPDAPHIIETVPRVGYRLIVPVSQQVQRRRGRAVATATLIAASVAAVWVGIAYTARSGRITTPTQREAHAFYVRGLVSLARETETDTAAARRLFAEAAKLDPTSAEPRAGLALTYLTHPKALAGVGPAEARAHAEGAAKIAATLDPSAPEVRRVIAKLKLAAGDWNAAELEFRRQIERAPTDAAGHEAYAEALALRGRFDDALREAHRARELDPLSPHAVVTLANTLRFARRYDEGIVAAQEALRLEPTYGPAFHTLGLCYEAQGQLERAIESYKRSGRPSGNLGHAYAVAGHTQEARLLLRDFEQQYRETGTGAGRIAQVYVGLREYDRAFDWLQRMVDEGGRATTLKVADVWDPLRSDPRFPVLLAKLGLE